MKLFGFLCVQLLYLEVLCGSEYEEDRSFVPRIRTGKRAQHGCNEGFCNYEHFEDPIFVPRIRPGKRTESTCNDVPAETKSLDVSKLQPIQEFSGASTETEDGNPKGLMQYFQSLENEEKLRTPLKSSNKRNDDSNNGMWIGPRLGRVQKRNRPYGYIIVETPADLSGESVYHRIRPSNESPEEVHLLLK